jgi:hypothetical protein
MCTGIPPQGPRGRTFRAALEGRLLHEERAADTGNLGHGGQAGGEAINASKRGCRCEWSETIQGCGALLDCVASRLPTMAPSTASRLQPAFDVGNDVVDVLESDR